MKKLMVYGRLQDVMEYEEALWYLFAYFRDNPGTGLPWLDGCSAEQGKDGWITILAPLKWGGMIEEYITFDAADKLEAAGVIRKTIEYCYHEEEIRENEEYYRTRAKLED